MATRRTVPTIKTVRFAATPSNDALPAPTALSATEGDHEGEIDLSWNSVKRARSYLIEHSEELILCCGFMGRAFRHMPGMLMHEPHALEVRLGSFDDLPGCFSSEHDISPLKSFERLSAPGDHPFSSRNYFICI